MERKVKEEHQGYRFMIKHEHLAYKQTPTPLPRRFEPLQRVRSESVREEMELKQSYREKKSEMVFKRKSAQKYILWIGTN